MCVRASVRNQEKTQLTHTHTPPPTTTLQTTIHLTPYPSRPLTRFFLPKQTKQTTIYSFPATCLLFFSLLRLKQPKLQRSCSSKRWGHTVVRDHTRSTLSGEFSLSSLSLTPFLPSLGSKPTLSWCEGARHRSAVRTVRSLSLLTSRLPCPFLFLSCSFLIEA